MFCFLAGAMITVSATAVGVWIEFPMPRLDDLMPNSVGWVLAVLAVGAVISVVAAYGYAMVARIANLAAPWMVLVFIAFGLVSLRQFIDATDTPIRSAADLWHLASTEIWRGGEPLPGQVKFTFWHVMFFAWFCNMAMHVGMSDLSVLRFARKSWYSIASAGGMYLGHFLAWIAASMLFAFELRQAGLVTRGAIEAAAEAGTLPAPLPGPLAYGACGLAGLLCVVIAGWTTANPTIYRAGLAFQAVVPRWSRFVVTLATGGLATLTAMFPAIAMRLLDFVALYGLVLMPMGAVVFIDFWLLPRMGLKSNYAELARRRVNPAAGLAWLLTLAICLSAVFTIGRWSLWFVSLPGWFVAAAIYVGVSWVYQKADTHSPETAAEAG